MLFEAVLMRRLVWALAGRKCNICTGSKNRIKYVSYGLARPEQRLKCLLSWLPSIR